MIEAQLASLHMTRAEPDPGTKRANTGNAPKFEPHTCLFQMCGVDFTRIDGVDVTTALVVVSETGSDMTKFSSDKRFASWLGVCPGSKITGGKVMRSKTKPCANRGAQALRTSQLALGAYYRRMCARVDKAKSVTAAAHIHARMIYTMLTKSE